SQGLSLGRGARPRPLLVPRAARSQLLPFAFFSVGFGGRWGRCQGRALLARRSEPLKPSPPPIECPWKAKGRSRRKLPGSYCQVDGRGCPIAEALVQTCVVIKMEVAVDARMGLRYRYVILQVHLLIFQRAPQSLDEDVVHAAATPVHADSNLALCQFPGEFLARELCPLVAVEDVRPAPPQRPLQRFPAEGRPQRQRQRPTQDEPTVPVHTATRYRKPGAIRIYVISVLHTWLTRSTGV